MTGLTLHAAVVLFGALVATEPVGSIDAFHDRLSPYGAWIDDARLGRVFVPDQADFVPYRDGHWRYTGAGMLWQSAEPFGWATSHYGRWGFSQRLERWAWVPDRTWGPAWVDWVEADGDFGWAAMPPAAYVGIGIAAPAAAWTFCPTAHVLDPDLAHVREPPARALALQRAAHDVGRFAVIGGARVVIGPTPPDSARTR